MQGRFARLRHGYLDEIARGSRVQAYLHELLTSRPSASEVRIFSLADHFVGSFLRFANAQIDMFWNRERMILKVDMWLNVLSLTGTAAIWTFAVFQAASGQITVGDLTLVFTASIQCRAQLDGLVSAIGDVFEGSPWRIELLPVCRPRSGVRRGDVGAPSWSGPARSQADGRWLGAARSWVFVSRVHRART